MADGAAVELAMTGIEGGREGGRKRAQEGFEFRLRVAHIARMKGRAHVEGECTRARRPPGRLALTAARLSVGPGDHRLFERIEIGDVEALTVRRRSRPARLGSSPARDR